MPRKTATYWLVKIARLTGWLLFFLVLLYLVTGFALCGEYGVSRWISAQRALEIHQLFEWPLIVVFVTHSAVTIYFALRRWGWIGRRARK
jgi:succinate dehydrogenase/fumarate reductase cytochrome b subunit